MPSTRSTRPVSRAASTLLLLSAALISSTSAAGLRTMKYAGCYSSSTPLKDQGSDIYQSSGNCQPICVDKNQPVMALTEGSNCLCGELLPAESDKVGDDKCDTPCDGYDKEMCGGHHFFGVYLSGTENNVDSYVASSSSSSGSATTPAPTSSSTAQAAVSTSVAPGTTVVVTMPSSQQQTEAPSPSTEADSDSGSKPNVAGIAAGVVVGVVAVAGIAIGLFFFMRHRKQKAAEEEYKRNQVSDFMRHGGTSGEGKPPNTGYSNMSDQRLDPEAGRRNSAGSIADDQDYSRRILRVANPS